MMFFLLTKRTTYHQQEISRPRFKAEFYILMELRIIYFSFVQKPKILSNDTEFENVLALQNEKKTLISTIAS